MGNGKRHLLISIGILFLLVFLCNPRPCSASTASDRLCQRAENLLQMKHMREAKLCFDRVIELDPHNVQAYVGRARALTELEERAQAMDDVNLVIRNFSDCGAAYRLRSRLDYELGKIELASNDISKAIAMDKTSKDRFGDYIMRGTYYRYLGQSDKALADLALAANLFPKSPIPFVKRGGLYYSLGRYRQSADDFTKAIRLANGDRMQILEWTSSRADAYEKMGRPDLADQDRKRINSSAKDTYGTFFPEQK
jgi:tetratricopeptide (TPR) repeat protein